MLEWTGERFLPWIRESTIAYEHLHRYAYAATLVKDQRVLDLASGEGYGSRMLAASAAFVAGLDIDENAIRHASAKYGASNLQFLVGSLTAVPIQDDHSFDTIVCFEAIEHIEDHEGLLREVKRLLKPNDSFIVSTPNKAVYHDEAEEENPFHVKELYFEEFRNLLARYFGNVKILGQRIHPASSIWSLDSASGDNVHEFVIERGGNGFDFIDAEKRIARYFIAIASDAVPARPPSDSVLLDQSDGLLEEKDQERIRQVTEKEAAIQSLEEALKWRETQIQQQQEGIQELEKGLQWTQNRAGELEKTIKANEEALAWRAAQVDELAIGKEYWERESATLTTQLQNTQRQLAAATDTLAGIYASRGWKAILKLRSIRDTLMGLVTSRRRA